MVLFNFKSPSITFAFVVALFVLLGLLFVVRMVRPQSAKERMTDWDAASNSYNDDDCISAWDKLMGGDFTDITNLYPDNGRPPPRHDSCIRRVANYTLVCPDETIYVHGCDGVTYKNACTAERNGIYNYSTENGVVSN